MAPWFPRVTIQPGCIVTRLQCCRVREYAKPSRIKDDARILPAPALVPTLLFAPTPKAAKRVFEFFTRFHSMKLRTLNLYSRRLLGMGKPNSKTTLVDRWLDRLKNTRPVALAIVVGAIIVGVATVWNALPQFIKDDTAHWVHPSPSLPGDTGWIFVGYYNVECIHRRSKSGGSKLRTESSALLH